MKLTWTIIGVSDVAGSFEWSQRPLGCRSRLRAHNDFGQILDTDGTVLLCLHEWERMRIAVARKQNDL